MDRGRCFWTVPNVATTAVAKTLVVVLLSTSVVLCALLARARDADDDVNDATREDKVFPGEKMMHEKEEGNFVDPFRSNACLDAELYCEQTLRPAVEQDASLREFLRDARKDAKMMNSWETVVPEERFEELKTPETLAIGTHETTMLRRTTFCTRFLLAPIARRTNIARFLTRASLSRSPSLSFSR